LRVRKAHFGLFENEMEYVSGAMRIYRIGWGQRVFSVVFTAFGAVFLVAIWSGVIFGTREASWIEIVVSIALPLGGGLFIARAFKDYIALAQSEILQQGLLKLQTLPFEKIRGRRRYLVKGSGRSPDVWHLKVEPNDDQFPTLDFEESYYTFDEYFRTWFSALPDLDERDKTGPKPSNFGLV
jgi:hypothetical protein